MTTIGTTPIYVLGERTRARASQLGAEFRDSPPELQHNVPAIIEIANSLELDINSKHVEFPGGLTATIGVPYALRIVPLPPQNDRETINEFLDKLHLRLAIDRGHLRPEFRDDLYVFCVGHEGSESDAYWESIAMRLESDEQICRKSIWLPPLEQTLWSKSADDFLERTFLGRPWMQSLSGSPTELDPLGRLINSISNEFEPSEHKKNWMSWIKIAAEHDDIELIADLIFEQSTSE